MTKYWLFFFVLMGLFGCSSPDEEEVRAGKYGMMGSDTPQYTAVLFMRAVYNDKDLNRAVSMSTDKFARILKGHHTNKNVQRQVFNLRLDNMKTEPISGGTLLFSEMQSEADIEMKIEGSYNGKKITEIKTLSMIKIKGDWKVSDVNNTI